MLNGSCACGRIRYERRGELAGPIGRCHCWQCRKHSGASFGTTGRRAEQHIFVSSKAPWLEIADGLPQQPGGAPFPERT